MDQPAGPDVFLPFCMACSRGWWNIIGPSVVRPTFFFFKFYLPILGAREDVLPPFWHDWVDQPIGTSNRPPLTVGNYNIILINLTRRGHPAYNMHTWIQNGKWMIKHRWVKQRKWKELWSKAEDISSIFPLKSFEDGFNLSIFDEIFLSSLEDCWNMDRLCFAPIKFGPNHFQWVSTSWGRANRGWKAQTCHDESDSLPHACFKELESLEPEKSGNVKYHYLLNYQFSGDVLVFRGLPGDLAASRVIKFRVSSIRLLWRTSSIRVSHTHADLCQGGSIPSIGSIDDQPPCKSFGRRCFPGKYWWIFLYHWTLQYKNFEPV